MASTGCADDKTAEAESDVIVQQPDASGAGAGSDVTVRQPASDASTASDATVQRPATSDASTGPAGHPADASAMPTASASSGDYSLIACTQTPAPSGPTYPACDGTVRCGGEAECIPTDVLADSPGAEHADMFPACSSGKCMPTVFRQGKFRFKPCMGELGDGRCVATCAALTRNPLASFLKAGAFGCGREEVCAPCAVDGTPNELCATDMCAE